MRCEAIATARGGKRFGVSITSSHIDEGEGEK
jgi:hypothetical protein